MIPILGLLLFSCIFKKNSIQPKIKVKKHKHNWVVGAHPDGHATYIEYCEYCLKIKPF